MVSVLCRLSVALTLALTAGSMETRALARLDAVPDFSGHWKFDAAKSTTLTREAQGRVAAIVFGDECVITQTAGALTLDITAGAAKIRAVYRLDGKPSENRSPGPPGQPDVPIVSTTRWVGETLQITTKSETDLGAGKVPVESLRTLWITSGGDLAVERRGTPAQVVSDAWAVYQRVK